jgi:ABC-type Mn2+/Zn2+ transport system ATPase subunit
MLVRAEHLAAGYRPGEPVIDSVEFGAEAGQTVAVLAPNGGGKTTLFRTLLGELAPVGGTFAVDGTVASVPQHDHARLDFPVSALDVALMGAYGRTPWWRRVARADRDAARAALDRVGLAGSEKAHFGSLSGGQRRRVTIARAIVQDARVLLLDEPFAGVDKRSEGTITRLLRDLARDGRTVLVSTHDLQALPALCDEAVLLHRRVLVHGTPSDVLRPEALALAFGIDVLRQGAPAASGAGEAVR